MKSENIIIPEPEPTHADGLANEMAEDGKWYVYRDNAVDYGYNTDLQQMNMAGSW